MYSVHYFNRKILLALFNPWKRMYDLAGNPSVVDIATQIIFFEESKENFQLFCSPVMQLFSFLYPQSLVTCSNDEIRSAAMNIIQKYGNDFWEDLEFEIRSFATEFKSHIIQKHEIKNIVKISYKTVALFHRFLNFISTHSIFNNPCYCCCCRKIVFRVEIN